MSKIVSKYIECYVYKKAKDCYKFLMLKRSMDKHPYPGIWQIITGKIEDNETAYNAAIRELKEEIGLKPLKFFVCPKASSFYTMHTDEVHLIPVFMAEVQDVNISLSAEHTEFEWLNINEAVERVHWYDQKENLKMVYEILLNPHLYQTLIEVKI